jgi:hypothetical protein
MADEVKTEKMKLNVAKMKHLANLMRNAADSIDKMLADPKDMQAMANFAGNMVLIQQLVNELE